jgi:type I restriction enzyme S subunit
MANMPMQGHRAIKWVDRPFGSGTKFINGDTLLARITPCLENGKTAFVDFLADGQVGWGSTEYIILRPKPPLPIEFGYYLARSEELRNHTIQNMTGTSGRQRAPASCFDKYMLAVPPESLANRFGDFARSVMAKIRSNDEQSRTLAALRDALLPRLMSGEVTVENVDRG